MMETLLSVRNLMAYYGTSGKPVRAVDDVTFDVDKNEIFGIAGESGCGKSTLASTVLRLLRPPGYIKSGEVLFTGKNLMELNDEELADVRWKHLSYVPQGSMNSLNPTMRIEEQISDAIETHDGKMAKNERIKRVGELLESVDLGHEVTRMYPHELSGGMRQRVIIAMAISMNPELVLADEPTTALDVVVQRGILELLLDIKKKMNSSILLITHDMAAQAEVADRVGIMYAGKIVEISDVKNTYKDPLHPYTKALTGSVPSIRKKKALAGLTGLPPDLKTPPPGCRFHPRCPNFMAGKCDVEEPKLQEEKGRLVACFLYGD